MSGLSATLTPPHKSADHVPQAPGCDVSFRGSFSRVHRLATWCANMGDREDAGVSFQAIGHRRARHQQSATWLTVYVATRAAPNGTPGGTDAACAAPEYSTGVPDNLGYRRLQNRHIHDHICLLIRHCDRPHYQNCRVVGSDTSADSLPWAKGLPCGQHPWGPPGGPLGGRRIGAAEWLRVGVCRMNVTSSIAVSPAGHAEAMLATPGRRRGTAKLAN
jgi:hypothetical protein